MTTLQTFDHIFVLDEGGIIAEGDYATLLRESPMFRQLFAHGVTETPQLGDTPDEISAEP